MVKGSFFVRGIIFRAITIFTVAMCAATSVQATIITSTDIVSTPKASDFGTGSGNGTLDLRLMTFSGSEIQNESGAFNADNGNNTLPQGGGQDTSTFDESYLITASELRAYYDLNFGVDAIDELVIFFDVNETGGGTTTNNLTVFDIVLSPTTIQGNPDATGDVTGVEQAAINQIYTGGSIIANLDSSKNLATNEQGAGFADYAIFTGINPYLLGASDILLFNFSMDELNNGAEEFFLDGTFSGADVQDAVDNSIVPVPAAVWLFGSALGLLGWMRRKQSV
jgi:hypothetical protein